MHKRYFCACTNVYLMTMISVERYYILKCPTNVKNLNKKKSYLAIFICVLLGLFWSFMPIIGWSHYSLEDSLTSCAVEWKEHSLNVTSYNIAIFIFVFIIPFGAIVLANLKTIYIVNIFICLLRISQINKYFLFIKTLKQGK